METHAAIVKPFLGREDALQVAVLWLNQSLVNSSSSPLCIDVLLTAVPSYSGGALSLSTALGVPCSVTSVTCMGVCKH